MYELIVNYDTGDSFGQIPDQTCVVGEWKSLEVAKRNAERIAEHYKLLQRSESSWRDDYLSEDEVWDIIKTKDFAPTKGESDSKHSDGMWDFVKMNSINLELDDGSFFRFSTYTWCGYFKSLNYVDVRAKEEDTRISI